MRNLSYSEILFNRDLLEDSIPVKQITMVVFVILLIAFVSNANSQFNVGGGGGGAASVNAIVSTTYCTVGNIIASAKSQVGTACSGLPSISNPSVDAANMVCNTTTETLGSLSASLTKNCPKGLQLTTPAPTTLTTSTQSTTVTTQTPGSTTPGPCTESETRSCNKSCQNQFDININFGGRCRRYGESSYACGCKRDYKCETYKNATCKKECKNGRICRIPEKNFPCVCQIGSGGFKQYRLPNSSYV
ncbi:unnamed protein product [Larinioides sclopetarius]|uniref:Uncharacterized protein n=1 Tax=Larinioides sclopetarius TaxID=280406 RepID=A0AAV1ZBZ8_9ARAC